MPHRRSLWYALFFTKDDDMDLTQIMFLVSVVFFFAAFTLTGLGLWRVSTAAWATFGGVFGTLAIAGTSHVVSQRIATSKAPGELAEGIARADGGFGSELSVYTVDERGEYAERDYGA